MTTTEVALHVVEEVVYLLLPLLILTDTTGLATRANLVRGAPVACELRAARHHVTGKLLLLEEVRGGSALHRECGALGGQHLGCLADLTTSAATLLLHELVLQELLLLLLVEEERLLHGVARSTAVVLRVEARALSVFLIHCA